MKKELVFLSNENLVTSSRIVAKTFGMNHRDVLRALDNKKSTAQNGALIDTMYFESTYQSANGGRQYREALMNRDGFTLLAMGFTGSKALKFQLDFIHEFNRMETELRNQQSLSLPTNYVEALKALVVAEEEKLQLQSDLNAAVETIEIQAPKATYFDKILSSFASMTPSAIAKDYGLTAVKLNRILHEEKIQYRVDGMWVLYAKHADKGYTTTETSLHIGENRAYSKMHTRWTQKGRLMIHELLESRGISPREEVVEYVGKM